MGLGFPRPGLLPSSHPVRPLRIPETLPFQKGQRLKTLRHLVRLFIECFRVESVTRGL